MGLRVETPTKLVSLEVRGVDRSGHEVHTGSEEFFWGKVGSLMNRQDC